MFKALFYPSQVKFYTDNVSASVTNSMSECYPVWFPNILDTQWRANYLVSHS